MMISPVAPILADALTFAAKQLTPEGKITIFALIIVSIFSWTVIITKARQLLRARAMGKRFAKAYRETRDPLEVARRGEEFDGAPAYELYFSGAEESEYQLKNNPVQVIQIKSLASTGPTATGAETDVLARQITTKMSQTSFETVRISIERAASKEALSLEKGMIILSTAVAGGPFIGLLGTVWGVMETFSRIGEANSASLTTMAPGVAAALLATITGLFVAIPAMFAYNYMVTTIRAITQELDGFAVEYATSLEHKYVDHRPLADEIRDAIQNSGRMAAPAYTPIAAAPSRPAPPPLPRVTRDGMEPETVPA